MAEMQFLGLKEGDIDPIMHKKIKRLVNIHEAFIVYLDDNDTIQWSCNRDDCMKAFGTIQNEISKWQMISNRIFSKDESFHYKILLAESYTLALTDNDEAAHKRVADVSEIIQKHGTKVLRNGYLLGTFIPLIIVVFPELLLFASSKQAIINFWGYGFYLVALAGLFGSLGSFTSSILYLSAYNPEISFNTKMILGIKMNEMDGLLRIVYGFIAGMVIAISIKGNMAFGFLNDIQLEYYSIMFLAFIGGVSQKFLPGLIKQAEEKY